VFQTGKIVVRPEWGLDDNFVDSISQGLTSLAIN